MNEQLSPSLNEGKQDINNSFFITHENNEATETVNLNLVIKDVFATQRKKLEALKVISRCDILPVIQTNKRSIEIVLNKLVAIILDNAPAKNKLFLYIKCEAKSTDVLDFTLPTGNSLYQISFHANTDVCNTEGFKSYWQTCEDLVKTLPNSFISLSHTNTGCLFFITLPGKFI